MNKRFRGKTETKIEIMASKIFASLWSCIFNCKICYSSEKKVECKIMFVVPLTTTTGNWFVGPRFCSLQRTMFYGLQMTILLAKKRKTPDQLFTLILWNMQSIVASLLTLQSNYKFKEFRTRNAQTLTSHFRKLFNKCSWQSAWLHAAKVIEMLESQLRNWMSNIAADSTKSWQSNFGSGIFCCWHIHNCSTPKYGI